MLFFMSSKHSPHPTIMQFCFSHSKFLQVRLLVVNLFEDLASEDTVLYVIRSLVLSLTTSLCLAKLHIMGPNNFYTDMVPDSLKRKHSNPVRFGCSKYGCFPELAVFVLFLSGHWYHHLRSTVSNRHCGEWNFSLFGK